MHIAERLRGRALWLRTIGARGFVLLVRRRLLGHQSGFYAANTQLFGGHGLEIGGPSRFFAAGGYTPVYLHASCVDNVNFAAHTRWEGRIEQGATFAFRPGAAPGRQFVHEATALTSIQDNAYDFLLSSHMLEHSANPLKALHEWKRVLKPGGALLLVLPHKEGTFDRFRPVTPLEHMVDDFRRDVGEDDRTHLAELLQLHDLQRDPGQTSRASLEAWIEANPTNRGAHHHVFDSSSAARLMDRAGFQLLHVQPVALDSIFIFARKPATTAAPDNAAFIAADAGYLCESPFRQERDRARRVRRRAAS
jgi:SAM-dependent methyltransferase